MPRAPIAPLTPSAATLALTKYVASCVTKGNSPANLLMAFAAPPIPSATVLIMGNSCEPMVLTMFSRAIFACSILAPVVFIAASNSRCIAPAVWALSATRPKALRKVSRLPAARLMSSAYSAPNSLVSAMERLCLSICSSLPRKSTIARSGFSLILRASSFAEMPRPSNAS